MTIAKKINPEFEGYGYLEAVLDAALHQAAAGKGKERHACDRPFESQPMQTISDLLQTTDGMAYQAIKKIQEATRMTHDAAIRELLGSINYTAGIIIKLVRDQEASDVFTANLRELRQHQSMCSPAKVDMIPLTQYNELLNRFEEMQKRVCEAD